jgi:hypothetical protein
MASLLSSASFRSIVPLWHAKETKNDHFQIEGMITGWELHLRSSEEYQFVLSDEYTSQSQLGDSNPAEEKVNFMDYSLGERITTVARKVLPKKQNLNPQNEVLLNFLSL